MSGGSLSPRTSACLIEGIRLFNEGSYWHAHEAWEEAWLEEEGLTRLWLQGLIQFTAAFHKGLRMGNPSGMARLFEQSAEKFERVLVERASCGGLDTAVLLELARGGCTAALQWQRTGRSPWPETPPPKLQPDLHPQ